MRLKPLAVIAGALALASLLGAAPPVPAVEGSCHGFDEIVPTDIKACKEPNVLNLNVPGWLPVCIDLNEGVPVFDVALEGVAAAVVQWSNKQQCVLAKFDAHEVVAALGDVLNNQVVTLTLTGTMVEETDLEVSIRGHDEVTILKRGGGR